MNYDNLKVDLQTSMETMTSATSNSPIRIWREDNVGKIDNLVKQRGYLLWDLDLDHFEECSEGYTNKAEGILDITVHARSRTKRQTLLTEWLDVFIPTVNNYRLFTPLDLTNSVIHNLHLVSSVDLTSEKTGHPQPEIPGLFSQFNIKVSF